ncbi:dTMP kinase [Saccharibacter sp. 17.LH.SD]|uniref:dTMP kinase n=1 Tax=Saccharibacter sp. 17.LH.SD TaxID=2689393 RepID=UPI00136FCCF3|nr:dTMP kinase [Saccharibacter sp. 17.LH.SD]MXV44556.1 dTMP kinase [Saccharibacter sp. 17.LH.SD]
MVRHVKGGLFITLEGGEGGGKSTQSRLLAEALRHDGLKVRLTREPGGTPGAEALRQQLLFGKEEFSWKAEILLHMTARCDHFDQNISPALEAGEIVICDRFHDSTWAYQGYGIGHGALERLTFITSLRELLHYEPEATFWLDVSLETAYRRLAQRGGKLDRYEGLDDAFHRRVREGFEHIYQHDDGKRIQRIDAEAAPDEVFTELYESVWALLRKKGV